jgi:hypothetical protein
MNFRHATALALVGWYLIVPPMTYNTKAGLWVNFKAQPTDWTIIEKYKSKEDCMKALGGRDRLAERAGRLGDAQTKELWRQAISKAQCISEGDLLRNGGFIGRIR